MPEISTENSNITDHLVSHLSENPDYQQFLQNASDCLGSDSLISVSLPVDKIDPLACLELLDEGKAYRYFWEKPSEDFSIAAGKSLHVLTASGKSRFKDINDQISGIKEASFEFSAIEHSHSGILFLGGFSFFDNNENGDWQSFGSASFTVPEWQIIREGQLTLLTLNFKASSFKNRCKLDEEIKNKFSAICEILALNAELELSGSCNFKQMPGNLTNSQAFNNWMDSVSSAKKLITQDKFDKIVLARETTIEVQDELEPTHIINTLREQYPNCYSFLVRQEGSKTFLGCTPERLLSFRKNYLLTEALAGSIQRGTTATEDAFLEKELMLSTKNADEHNYVIKAIEQKLSPLVKKIERGSKPVIKKLTNVQHLFTPITAWLKEEVSPLTILEQLHPTPAVGGYPWEKARPYIRKLESFDRGWYAGPIGWLNSNNGGEFAVAIRSGLIDNNRAIFYAGCGIVANSDAEAEWEETILKLRPMLSALQYD